MKTIKCDRCGKEISIFNKMVNYSDKYWRLNLSYDNHPYSETKLDICDECKKSLYNWLKEFTYYETN